MIILEKEISNNLALRDSAKRLFDNINKNVDQEIIVDFSNIVTISRSFTHEYIENKKKTSKSIKEINMPMNVTKMFEIVNRNNPKVKLVEIEKIEPIKL